MSELFLQWIMPISILILVIMAAFFLQIWYMDRRKQRELESVKFMREQEEKERLRAAEERRYQMQIELKEMETKRSLEESKIKEEKDKARKLDEIKLQMELEKNRESRRQEKLESQLKIQQKLNDELLSKLKENAEQQIKDGGYGGFIILDLPEEHRSIFNDLLKGFEEYAKLKGYTIYFSADNSMPHKIAFKFTLGDVGLSVSTQKVRKDIEEYINKIKNGESLDELPVIISPVEHSLILTTLKNRLSFLEHNYNLQKNSIQFYEDLLRKIASSKGITPQASVFFQTGGINKPHNYIATNSSRLIQGEAITYEDNSDQSVITISNSFNVKKEQIDKLNEVVSLLKRDSIDDDKRQEAMANFDKIKEELSEEENPDKSKIFKWLNKTKKALENLILSHDTVEAINWVYHSFNFLKDQVIS